MRIKRKGCLCRVAFRNITSYRYDVPETISICTLFWKFVSEILSLSIVYLILIPFFAVLLLLVKIVMSPLCILFGYRFVISTFLNMVYYNFLLNKNYTIDVFGLSDSDPILFREIKSWPKIFGYRILPVYAFLVVGVVLIVVNTENILTPYGLSVLQSFTTRTVFVSAFVSILAVIGFKKLFKTEFWQLTKEFAKAKKEKVCPIIEIID